MHATPINIKKGVAHAPTTDTAEALAAAADAAIDVANLDETILAITLANLAPVARK